jgi:hypothetical protein
MLLQPQVCHIACGKNVLRSLLIDDHQSAIVGNIADGAQQLFIAGEQDFHVSANAGAHGTIVGHELRVRIYPLVDAVMQCQQHVSGELRAVNLNARCFQVE